MKMQSSLSQCLVLLLTVITATDSSSLPPGLESHCQWKEDGASLHCRHLNLSHNKLHRVGAVFREYSQLRRLDLSHNRLSQLDRRVLEELPSLTLSHLDISHNPWPCLPSLSWLYPWSLSLSANLRAKISSSSCNIVNSPTGQHAPLITVMEHYTSHVSPHCHHSCSCHFYHFAAGTNISYTVIVNCTNSSLTSFPSLPSQTTVLDLSHNRLSQDSLELLDVVRQNYLDITSLILSHNNIQSIGTKLLKLKLHRSFKADHNSLTDIPYDFAQLLQKYDTMVISLANNPWRCSCNAQITDTSLQGKLNDRSEIVCAKGSVPDAIVGRKLNEVSSSILCPRSEKSEEREAILKALCGILAFLILVTITKLLYDYWNYRKRGKLPWIVYRMP